MPMEISANIKERNVALADSLPRQQPDKTGRPVPATMGQKLPLPMAEEKQNSKEEQLDLSQSGEIEKTVEELNLHVQNLKRDLHFSVDADSGETIIRVVDSETQKTIRTIPSEDISDLGQRLAQNSGLLLRTSI